MYIILFFIFIKLIPLNALFCDILAFFLVFLSLHFILFYFHIFRIFILFIKHLSIFKLLNDLWPLLNFIFIIILIQQLFHSFFLFTQILPALKISPINIIFMNKIIRFQLIIIYLFKLVIWKIKGNCKKSLHIFFINKNLQKYNQCKKFL